MTPDAPPPSEPASRARINLEWLLRLRWGLLLGQAVVIAVAAYGLELVLPVPVLAALLAASGPPGLALAAVALCAAGIAIHGVQSRRRRQEG